MVMLAGALREERAECVGVLLGEGGPGAVGFFGWCRSHDDRVEDGGEEAGEVGWGFDGDGGDAVGFEAAVEGTLGVLVGFEVGGVAGAVEPGGESPGQVVGRGVEGEFEEFVLVVGGGEAGEGPDLGVGQFAVGERVRGRVERPQRTANARV